MPAAVDLTSVHQTAMKADVDSTLLPQVPPSAGPVEPQPPKKRETKGRNARRPRLANKRPSPKRSVDLSETRTEECGEKENERSLNSTDPETSSVSGSNPTSAGTEMNTTEAEEVITLSAKTNSPADHQSVAVTVSPVPTTRVCCDTRQEDVWRPWHGNRDAPSALESPGSCTSHPPVVTSQAPTLQASGLKTAISTLPVVPLPLSDSRKKGAGKSKLCTLKSIVPRYEDVTPKSTPYTRPAPTVQMTESKGSQTGDADARNSNKFQKPRNDVTPVSASSKLAAFLPSALESKRQRMKYDDESSSKRFKKYNDTPLQILIHPGYPDQRSPFKLSDLEKYSFRPPLSAWLVPYSSFEDMNLKSFLQPNPHSFPPQTSEITAHPDKALVSTNLQGSTPPGLWPEPSPSVPWQPAPGAEGRDLNCLHITAAGFPQKIMAKTAHPGVATVHVGLRSRAPPALPRRPSATQVWQPVPVGGDGNLRNHPYIIHTGFPQERDSRSAHLETGQVPISRRSRTPPARPQRTPPALPGRPSPPQFWQPVQETEDRNFRRYPYILPTDFTQGTRERTTHLETGMVPNSRRRTPPALPQRPSPQVWQPVPVLGNRNLRNHPYMIPTGYPQERSSRTAYSETRRSRTPPALPQNPSPPQVWQLVPETEDRNVKTYSYTTPTLYTQEQRTTLPYHEKAWLEPFKSPEDRNLRDLHHAISTAYLHEWSSCGPHRGMAPDSMGPPSRTAPALPQRPSPPQHWQSVPDFYPPRIQPLPGTTALTPFPWDRSHERLANTAPARVNDVRIPVPRRPSELTQAYPSLPHSAFQSFVPRSRHASVDQRDYLPLLTTTEMPPSMRTVTSVERQDSRASEAPPSIHACFMPRKDFSIFNISKSTRASMPSRISSAPVPSKLVPRSERDMIFNAARTDPLRKRQLHESPKGKTQNSPSTVRRSGITTTSNEAAAGSSQDEATTPNRQGNPAKDSCSIPLWWERRSLSLSKMSGMPTVRDRWTTMQSGKEFGNPVPSGFQYYSTADTGGAAHSPYSGEDRARTITASSSPQAGMDLRTAATRRTDVPKTAESRAAEAPSSRTSPIPLEVTNSHVVKEGEALVVD